MIKKFSNPFVTAGYIGPEYFCDREKETSLLMKAIASKRNVTLISLRRMGKTGLLKHVKYLVGKEKSSPLVVYADLLPTMNGNDLLNLLSTALLREKQHEKNILEKLLSLLATLRPRVSYDQLTGQPMIELKTESPAEVQYGFNHLLEFIAGIRKEMIFVLDEFQQIGRYPEKNIEQLLRTVIQANPGIPFIFSGSSKHMLESMFSTAGRPFYQSSELMYLGKIEESVYGEFIVNKFKKARKEISPEALKRVFEWTRLHTFYVQYICNLLYESEEDMIDTALVNTIFQRLLTASEPLFTNYRNLLPEHQYSLLRAIAAENKVDKPTAGAFIQEHRLNSASSVATSLKALAEKEMIVSENGSWQVYDVFFSRWLEYHYGGKRAA